MNNLRIHKRKAKLVILLILLLLGAVIFFSLQIREITVTGNKQHTAEEMEDLIFKSRWDKNAIICLYKDRFRGHEQIPFVEDYKIVFQSPTKVEIIVYEKSVVGVISYMGSYMYFDKDGIIVESSSERLEGIPLVTGLKYGHITLHQPLPVENESIFDQILTLTQLLANRFISVDRIQYDSQGNATLVLGTIRVVLGSNNQMDEKILELESQLKVMTGLSGTLYLDGFDDKQPPSFFPFVKDK